MLPVMVDDAIRDGGHERFVCLEKAVTVEVVVDDRGPAREAVAKCQIDRAADGITFGDVTGVLQRVAINNRAAREDLASVGRGEVDAANGVHNVHAGRPVVGTVARWTWPRPDFSPAIGRDAWRLGERLQPRGWPIVGLNMDANFGLNARLVVDFLDANASLAPPSAVALATTICLTSRSSNAFIGSRR